MKHFKIESKNLEFKNLLSGPAPIGRILNYINYAGKSELFHKNGYRYLDFTNNIGSAWTTEFMIGIGVVQLGNEINDKTILKLTPEGQKIYSLISNINFQFNEGTNPSDLENVKEQIQKANSNLLSELKEIFISSYPFLILRDYLNEYGFYYENSTSFMDDFFESVKQEYDKTDILFNRFSRTPTSRNRVPSLLQLCQLFNMLEIRNGSLNFNSKLINQEIKTENSSETMLFSSDELANASKLDTMVLSNIDKLVEKYGIDGTQLVELVVRNGNLQKLFKHNLMVSQGKKCVLCNINQEELLIASHIRPASKSDVFAKSDYNNGLLLCCNHDKLFDRYLITFDATDGKLKISKSLNQEDISILNLDTTFKLPKELLTPERQKYLSEHNNEFNIREENR